MIVVECKPDKALIQKLSNSSKIIHAPNKSEAVKFINKIGKLTIIIDEDPDSNQPKILDSLNLLEDKSSIKILGNSNCIVIILSPRLEEWIIEAAKEANIDMNRYGLSNDPNQLHRIINRRINNLKRLICDIEDRSRRIITLKKILNR